MDKKEYDRAYYLANKEKIRERHKAYYQNNWKDKNSEYQRRYYVNFSDKKANSRLLREYGITLDQYNQMFEEQEGKCAICGKHQSELKFALAVDHNHDTGEVRGLLCRKCNTGIGLFDDNKSLIHNALTYLGGVN